MLEDLATWAASTGAGEWDVLLHWIGKRISVSLMRGRGNNGHHPDHTLVPASVETYGSLRKSLVRYLNALSEVAAARWPAVTTSSFLAGAHRKLSVALIKCQGYVYRDCANLMARAAGRQVSPGAELPPED